MTLASTLSLVPPPVASCPPLRRTRAESGSLASSSSSPGASIFRRRKYANMSRVRSSTATTSVAVTRARASKAVTFPCSHGGAGESRSLSTIRQAICKTSWSTERARAARPAERQLQTRSAPSDTLFNWDEVGDLQRARRSDHANSVTLDPAFPNAPASATRQIDDSFIHLFGVCTRDQVTERAERPLVLAPPRIDPIALL